MVQKKVHLTLTKLITELSNRLYSVSAVFCADLPSASLVSNNMTCAAVKL